MVSVRGIKAEYIIVFTSGIVFLALGIYGVFYLFTVELPSGHYSELPFGAAVGIFLGLILIWQTYPIFFSLSKSKASGTIVCPYCGALTAEDAAVCEKCKRELDD
jgi:hypothetical protein